jgi:hypothetical protein
LVDVGAVFEVDIVEADMGIVEIEAGDSAQYVNKNLELQAFSQGICFVP